MKVIIHSPQTSESINDFKRKVSCVHADFVISKIKNLPCSKEQKLALLETLKNDLSSF